MAAEGYAILSLTLSGPSRCSGIVDGGQSVAAVSDAIFTAQNVCFKQMRVTHDSKTIEASIVTSCPGCADTGILLSPGAWRLLEDVSIRRMNVTWEILETSTSSSTTTASSTTATTAEITTAAPPPQQEQVERSASTPKASVLVPAILLPILGVLAALILFVVFRRRRQRKKDWPTAFSIYHKPEATPKPSMTVRDDGKVVLSNESAPSAPTLVPARDAKLGRVKEPASPPSSSSRTAADEPDEEVNALHRAMHSAGLNVQAVLATLRGNGAAGDTRLPAYDP